MPDNSGLCRRLEADLIVLAPPARAASIDCCWAACPSTSTACGLLCEIVPNGQRKSVAGKDSICRSAFVSQW